MDYIDLEKLVKQCAVAVAPTTMMAIIKHESRGNPYAIGDNDNLTGKPIRANDVNEAASIALNLIKQGHNIDMGLSQINVTNLKAYNVTVKQIFEPCTNIRVGSLILSKFYANSVKRYGEGELSLLHALSAYNTGSFYRGKNYVQKVLNGAGSKASISQVAWQQPKINTKKINKAKTQTRSFFSPIIAFSHIPSDISEQPNDSIIAISDN